MNNETIIYDNCGELSDIKLAFYAYEYKCCSIKCINLLKTKRQNIENKNKNELKPKSAFVYSMSGGYL